MVSASSAGDPADPVTRMRAAGSGTVAACTLVSVRRRRDLLGMVRHLRRVRRDAARLADPPLLLRTSWDLRRGTVTFLSVWSVPRSVLMFNGLASHVDAVRWVLDGRHRTWTGIYRGAGVSDLSTGPGAPFWLGEADRVAGPS